jgi:SAM-dependent methyltransferase
MNLKSRYEQTPGKISVSRQILRVVKMFTPVLYMSRAVSSFSRKISSVAHHLQFLIEWGVDNPEYFDHFIDQHYAWSKSRNSLMWERGVYSGLAIQAMSSDQLPNVLDLCCGDGFMAYHFYSLQAEKVTAIDFDRLAIKRANKHCSYRNIEYIFGDIRTDIPEEKFHNIIWDAAIEHFTETEITTLMSTIKSRLIPNGILSGYTIMEEHDGSHHLHQHEYEFHSKEDLARFLEPHFTNVQVIETKFPNRTNLYFFATDGVLPTHSKVTYTSESLR